MLIEKLTKITDHTPKDLAGWHVSVVSMSSLHILDGRSTDFRQVEWQKWYEKYKEVIADVSENQ